MLIQIVLILAVLIGLVALVRDGGKTYVQASKRVGLLVFAGVSVFAVIRPESFTVLAGFLGVGRGTDLLLYGLVVAFVFGMLSMYVRFRVVDRRYTDLARAFAIRDAELVNAERGLARIAPPGRPTSDDRS